MNICNLDEYLQSRINDLDTMLAIASRLNATRICDEVESVKAGLYAAYDGFMEVMAQKRQAGDDLIITGPDWILARFNEYNHQVNQIRKDLISIIDQMRE